MQASVFIFKLNLKAITISYSWTEVFEQGSVTVLRNILFIFNPVLDGLNRTAKILFFTIKST